jgi:hypothetical protein
MIAHGHAVSEIQAAVTDQAIECDVYRATDDGPYDDDKTHVGTVAIAISGASASSQLYVEGVDQDHSLVGHIVPTGDRTLTEPIHVGDELRHPDSGRRYDVDEVVAVPSEFDPQLWQLSLSRATTSA